MILIKAIKEGDANTVLNLLRTGVDINFQNKNGRTPLMIAFKHHASADIINIILEKSPDINLVDKYERNTLYYALSPYYFTDERLHHCQSLINRGININHTDKFGRCPLMYAPQCSREATRLLLNQKEIKINVTDSFGWTSLFVAFRANMPDCLDISLDLISAGADINVIDVCGNHILLHTITHGFVFRESTAYTVLEFLLSHGADPFLRNKQGRDALSYFSYHTSSRYIICQYMLKALISASVIITNNYFAIIPHDIRGYITKFSFFNSYVTNELYFC